MTSLHRMGRPAPIEPGIDPERARQTAWRIRQYPPLTPRPWFNQTAKSEGDVVISDIGQPPDFSKCRRDKWCRGRCCRPRLNGGTR